MKDEETKKKEKEKEKEAKKKKKDDKPPPPPYQAQNETGPYWKNPSHCVVIFATPSEPLPTIPPDMKFGAKPVQVQCPHCLRHIETTTIFEGGIIAWVLFGIMCALGLWLCSCIPFCLECTQDATHICPNCSKFIGRFHRIERKKKKKDQDTDTLKESEKSAN